MCQYLKILRFYLYDFCLKWAYIYPLKYGYNSQYMQKYIDIENFRRSRALWLHVHASTLHSIVSLCTFRVSLPFRVHELKVAMECRISGISLKQRLFEQHRTVFSIWLFEFLPADFAFKISNDWLFPFEFTVYHLCRISYPASPIKKKRFIAVRLCRQHRALHFLINQFKYVRLCMHAQLCSLFVVCYWMSFILLCFLLQFMLVGILRVVPPPLHSVALNT